MEIILKIQNIWRNRNVELFSYNYKIIEIFYNFLRNFLQYIYIIWFRLLL